uniref:Uncharacterized protein n=1 Tax=Spongospora subterranea TaxID=70186 RepID=A0A0H5QLY4_9EUKA|eukprot:CRZ02350.1 hypothetical protein [Spongospora subterranea]
MPTFHPQTRKKPNLSPPPQTSFKQYTYILPISSKRLNFFTTNYERGESKTIEQQQKHKEPIKHQLISSLYILSFFLFLCSDKAIPYVKDNQKQMIPYTCKKKKKLK